MINFGLVRDKFDSRDKLFKVRTPITELPDECMRPIEHFHIRYNQLNLGSCVANAVVAGCQISMLTNGQPVEDFSRLFVYYNLRTDENKSVDSGGSIRDGIKAVNKYGMCHEATWKYDTARFAEKPPVEAYKEAEDHQLFLYERIYPVTKEAIMDAIFRGYGVVYGMALHESFMSDKTSRTGYVPVPKCKCIDPIVGYHAKLISGYRKHLAVKELNSWGDDWGQGGLCDVPWEIILNPKEAFDFWAITKMEDPIN